MTVDDLSALIRGLTPTLRDIVAKEIGDVARRVTSLEAIHPRDGRDGMPGRDGQPGPRGDAGVDGMDGKDGKDGTDGLGIDNLDAVYDGDRTLTFRFQSGDRVKEFRQTLTGLVLYRGRWQPDRTYSCGDIVTIGGSHWHCNEPSTTRQPGDGSGAWTLSAKGIGRR